MYLVKSEGYIDGSTCGGLWPSHHLPTTADQLVCQPTFSDQSRQDSLTPGIIKRTYHPIPLESCSR